MGFRQEDVDFWECYQSKRKTLLGSDTIWLKRIGVRVFSLESVPLDGQENAKEIEETTADGTRH